MIDITSITMMFQVLLATVLGMVIGEVQRVSPKDNINIVGINRADGETILPQQILDKIKELV